MKLADHVPLRDHCRLGTGGAADYYVSARSPNEVLAAVAKARNEKIRYRVLGEGTGVLVSDSGFPGLIIQNRSSTILFIHDRSQVIVDAGTPLSQIVTRTLSSAVSGLEFLTDEPGTIGGAVYRNRSRFGYEISQYVSAATLLFPLDPEPVVRVERDWFEFGPTTSKLKRLAENSDQSGPIILSVTLQLSRTSGESCLQRLHQFSALSRSFPPREAVLEVFGHLTSDKESLNSPLGRKVEAQPVFFLEEVVARRLREGDITLSLTNPNFLINRGQGKSREALELVEAVETHLSETYSTPPPRLFELLGYWD